MLAIQTELLTYPHRRLTDAGQIIPAVPAEPLSEHRLNGWCAEQAGAPLEPGVSPLLDRLLPLIQQAGGTLRLLPARFPPTFESALDLGHGVALTLGDQTFHGSVWEEFGHFREDELAILRLNDVVVATEEAGAVYLAEPLATLLGLPAPVGDHGLLDLINEDARQAGLDLHLRARLGRTVGLNEKHSRSSRSDLDASWNGEPCRAQVLTDCSLEYFRISVMVGEREVWGKQLHGSLDLDHRWWEAHDRFIAADPALTPPGVPQTLPSSASSDLPNDEEADLPF